MSKKKSLIDLDKDAPIPVQTCSIDKVVSFKWRGKSYTETVRNNLRLSSIGLVEVMKVLNEAPSKFAYWSSLLADVNLEIAKLEKEHSFWNAEKYLQVVSRSKKKLTETQIRNTILLKYPKSMRSYLTKRDRLLWVKAKLVSITKSYDMSSRTLQSISGLLKQELAMIRGHS